MPPPNDPPVILSVPAEPRSVQLVRSITAAAAARLELPYDAVDDLRIAVAEACNELLDRPGGRLTLRVWPNEDALTIAVSIDAPVEGWPPPDTDTRLGWRVIVGLTDAASRELIEGEPGIVMVCRTLAAERP